MIYTSNSIKNSVMLEEDLWFSSYAAGRREGWACSRSVKDCVCIASWMRAELTWLGLNDDDRRTLEARFNRESRSNDNQFEVAAQIMNDAVAGNVPQGRIPHRRWG